MEEKRAGRSKEAEPVAPGWGYIKLKQVTGNKVTFLPPPEVAKFSSRGRGCHPVGVLLCYLLPAFILHIPVCLPRSTGFLSKAFSGFLSQARFFVIYP